LEQLRNRTPLETRFFVKDTKRTLAWRDEVSHDQFEFSLSYEKLPFKIRIWLSVFSKFTDKGPDKTWVTAFRRFLDMYAGRRNVCGVGLVATAVQVT
jgi:hypothetical protein